MASCGIIVSIGEEKASKKAFSRRLAWRARADEGRTNAQKHFTFSPGCPFSPYPLLCFCRRAYTDDD
jgi:hypothetical protein